MTNIRTYRSRDGRHDFPFRFDSSGTCVTITSLRRPPLGNRDSSVSKTHVYGSGEICFVAGREPRTQPEAESRAAEWAEYYLEYRRTGVAQ